MQIGKIIPVTLDNARLYPLTILGAAVPQFQMVTTLEAGMLPENTPNVNFSSIFDSLESITGPVVIVGNAQLTSLDGELLVGKLNAGVKPLKPICELPKEHLAPHSSSPCLRVRNALTLNTNAGPQLAAPPLISGG